MRVVARRFVTLLALLAATLVGALAAEFVLPEGTRVTILTGEGGEFLGHGEVIAGELVLPALPRDVSSVVVFINRGGDEVQILRGLVRSSTLIVNVPGRGQVAFGELAVEAGVALKAKPVAGVLPDGVPPDGPPGDGGVGPPGGSPPGPPGGQP